MDHGRLPHHEPLQEDQVGHKATKQTGRVGSAMGNSKEDRPSPVKLPPVQVTSIMPPLIGQGANNINMNGNNYNEDEEDEESVHETGII